MEPDDLRKAVGLGGSCIAAIVPELPEGVRGLSPYAEADSETARFRLFDAVVRFLDHASRERPILVVLDDLHWADQASLLLLEFLAQELGQLPVLIVGTYRDGELARPLIQTLGELARSDLQIVELGGLNPADVGRLLEASTRACPPDAVVRLVHGRTDGNPFFVTEIARSLGQRMAGVRIPESVKSALAGRLSRLSGLANQLLLAGSVVGREFDLELLEGTLGEPDRRELLNALDEALRAAIIEPAPAGGERYQFRHALIRDALYEALSPSHQARWHARVADALARMLGGQVAERAAELAYHASRAGRFMSQEHVVKYSTIAGQQMLAVHAHDEALPHFERAWKARERFPVDADAVSILVGLGYAQAATAHRWNRQEAWDNLRRALDYEINAGHVAQAVTIATHACITPESADGVVHVVQQLLGMVAAGSREAGWLHARWAAASYFENGDYRAAQAGFDRALAAAAAHADVALESRTLACATVVDHFEQRWSDVVSNSRRAVELARRVDDLHAETYARYRAAYALMCSGSSDEARLEAEAHLACAERLGDHGLLGDALYTNAAIAQLSGDWRVARAHSDRGLALSPSHLSLLHARMLLEYETGNSEAGAEYLARLIESGRMSGRYPLAPVLAAVGVSQAERLAHRAGDATRLGTTRAALSRAFPLPTVEALARIGRALIAVHDRDATRLVPALEDLQTLKGLIVAPFLVTVRISGCVAHFVGRLTQAAADFEDALTFCRRARYRPELAWTCYEYGRLLVDGGSRSDREKASALLAEANEIACDLAMHPLLREVTAFQDRYRSRLTRKPAGLTDREIAVLPLLVEGKTNKEIAQALDISVNTVAVHVARILRKTGCSNRTEAAAFANREHLVGVTVDRNRRPVNEASRPT